MGEQEDLLRVEAEATVDNKGEEKKKVKETKEAYYEVKSGE